MSLFDVCREVSSLDAAIRLGINVKQRGASGWALCPMHGERGHASLCFYSGSRGWYCYGCHKGGDAVKLYQEYLGLDALDAARQLAQDFGLAVLDDDYEPTLHVTVQHLQKALHKRRDVLRARFANIVCDADDYIQRLIHSEGMEAVLDNPQFTLLLNKKADAQTKLDQLTDADDAELLDLIKKYEER